MNIRIAIIFLLLCCAKTGIAMSQSLKAYTSIHVDAVKGKFITVNPALKGADRECTVYATHKWFAYYKKDGGIRPAVFLLHNDYVHPNNIILALQKTMDFDGLYIQPASTEEISFIKLAIKVAHYYFDSKASKDCEKDIASLLEEGKTEKT